MHCIKNGGISKEIPRWWLLKLLLLLKQFRYFVCNNVVDYNYYGQLVKFEKTWQLRKHAKEGYSLCRCPFSAANMTCHLLLIFHLDHLRLSYLHRWFVTQVALFVLLDDKPWKESISQLIGSQEERNRRSTKGESTCTKKHDCCVEHNCPFNGLKKAEDHYGQLIVKLWKHLLFPAFWAAKYIYG